MDAPPSQTLPGDLSREPVQAHRRWYRVAGVTLQVESPLPILATTFASKFTHFAVEGPGPDTVVLRHHFGMPDPEALGPSASGVGERDRTGSRENGREGVYRNPPWAIYRQGDSWVYEGISTDPRDPALHMVARFDDGHTEGDLYHPPHVADWWRDGGLESLTLMPSDQIVLARLFADREACLLHSAGVVLDGHGLVFVGHSDAGKSTTVELLRHRFGDRLEILCDDRIVVRRGPEGFRAFGTWNHGDVPDVSPGGAPLRAVLFLEQGRENDLRPPADRGEAVRRLLATIVKPLETAEWWHKEMDVLERLVAEVPCHTMRFDRSGAIVREIESLVRADDRDGGVATGAGGASADDAAGGEEATR